MNFTAVLLTGGLSGDAINWMESDIPHSRKACINPAPFGTQCTQHAALSLHACLLDAQCHSVTCPSPEPYVHDVAHPRRDGIKGAVCQLRAIHEADWHGKTRATKHGMCKQSGCRNYFLTPVQVSLTAEVASGLQARLRELVASRDASVTLRPMLLVPICDGSSRTRSGRCGMLGAGSLEAASFLGLGDLPEVGTVLGSALDLAETEHKKGWAAWDYKVLAVPTTLPTVSTKPQAHVHGVVHGHGAGHAPHEPPRALPASYGQILRAAAARHRPG
jgi:hypothetical protein